MSNEAIILTLLSIIGALLLFVGAFYINSVEAKFEKLDAKIENLTNIVGIRKMNGSIEHRKQGG
jgi:ABC-type sulfate transport system permease component